MDFLREVRLLTALAHPNILELRAIYWNPPVERDGNGSSSRGSFCMVMGFCEGGDLASWIDRHVKGRSAAVRATNSESERVRRWCGELLRATDHCQQHGVVHRDIKPANLLLHGLGPEPQLRMADFGHSRRLEELRDGGAAEEAALWRVSRCDEQHSHSLSFLAAPKVIDQSSPMLRRSDRAIVVQRRDQLFSADENADEGGAPRARSRDGWVLVPASEF
jgi:serine/threonine protein kinase